MLKGFALLLGKTLAVLASVVAFLSNFTGCLIYVNQPVMPQRVRTMKMRMRDHI